MKLVVNRNNLKKTNQKPNLYNINFNNFKDKPTHFQNPRKTVN